MCSGKWNNLTSKCLTLSGRQCGPLVKADSAHAGSPCLIPSGGRKINGTGIWSRYPTGKTLICMGLYTIVPCTIVPMRK